MSFLGDADGGRAVFLGDRKYDVYGPDWIVAWPLVTTDDAGVVACRLTRATPGAACIGVNGRRGEEYDDVGPPALSRDGSTVAYRARRGDRWFVVIGDRAGPVFDALTDPALSNDGRTAAHGAARGGRWFLVLGEKETPLDRAPFSVFISPDGRRAGIVVLDAQPDGGSEAHVEVDGWRSTAFSLVGRPLFDPAGRRVAFGAERGKTRFVVVGDKAVEVPGLVGDPVFSADGGQVGCGARIGRELWWKVLDLR